MKKSVGETFILHEQVALPFKIASHTERSFSCLNVSFKVKGPVAILILKFLCYLVQIASFLYNIFNLDMFKSLGVILFTHSVKCRVLSQIASFCL